MQKMTIDDVAKQLGHNIALIQYDTVPLKTINVGQKFLIDKKEYILLNKYDEPSDTPSRPFSRCMILLNNPTKMTVFGENNNFGTRIKDMKKDVGVKSESLLFYERTLCRLKGYIRERDVDLTADNGYCDYDGQKMHVAPLTLKEYQQYSVLIPKVDNNWWLVTSNGTISTNNTSKVCCVDSNRNIIFMDCNEEALFRPAILISGELPVVKETILTTSALNSTI